MAKNKLPHAKVQHHYYSSLGGLNTIQFLRTANAYKNDTGDDYTTKRIRLSTIISYEAFAHTEFNKTNYHSKEMVADLGDIAYGIELHFSQGEYSGHEHIYFWTKQQRDETLEQLDIAMGVCELSIEPSVTVINPRHNKIPDGSATIQDLPKL